MLGRLIHLRGGTRGSPAIGRRRMRPVRRLTLALGLLSATVIALCGDGLAARTSAAGAVQRPNIVFVLTDDLDWSLVTAQYMPHVTALGASGATFDHYIVSDSLCCPSRSSIFTGLFPHDSGVYTNTGADGGYYAFTHHKPNLETQTFAVAVQQAGYLTSMMGKYLNGYGEPAMARQVPPYERANTYKLLTRSSRARLHRMLSGLERCHDAPACWTAGGPQPG
jgi:N-acetylglucosamine-6-sulfatase